MSEWRVGGRVEDRRRLQGVDIVEMLRTILHSWVLLAWPGAITVPELAREANYFVLDGIAYTFFVRYPL
jgi:hypothetical protein